MKEEILYQKILEYQKDQNLCIYASFDIKSRVQEYVYHQISELQHELLAHVVFVTTSDVLLDEDKERFSELGVSVIHRENTGYDFKSYYIGLEAFKHEMNSFMNIYHTNDSVYGPFRSISDIREKMNDSCFDIWGMTDSWQINYHLQSYFMAFKSGVFESLTEFWSQYKFEGDYHSVVKQGEVGMSQFMIKKGFCLGAAFPVEQHLAPFLIGVENAFDNAHVCMRSMSKPRWYSITKRAMKLNASFVLWKPLMKSGYPFLKKKLLLEWANIGSHSGDWLNIIDDDYFYAKTVTQASIHRDRPPLTGVLRPKWIHFLLNPVKYMKAKKNWSKLMRGLISD